MVQSKKYLTITKNINQRFRSRKVISMSKFNFWVRRHKFSNPRPLLRSSEDAAPMTSPHFWRNVNHNLHRMETVLWILQHPPNQITPKKKRPINTKYKMQNIHD
eukprot:PhF_6_TR42928/c0_g1_i2/m.65134